MTRNIISKLRTIAAKIKNRLPRLRTPDPEHIFTHIYKNKIWGEGNLEIPYYSGGGSDDEFAIPYVNAIVDFISKNKIKSIVDLGCGDFRIGKKITELTDVNFIGVDIVDDLIEYNKKQFSSASVSFYKKNIASDKLPAGELYLVRQVFQHLSNSQIKKALKNLSACKHLIITEHQPVDSNCTPNIDKPVGAGIRLEGNSGVYLEHPPFNKKVKKLFEISPQQDKSSVIATYIIFNDNSLA